eukprot:scaffold91036_cov27-Tisochrysis_lutea.AAC.9
MGRAACAPAAALVYLPRAGARRPTRSHPTTTTPVQSSAGPARSPSHPARRYHTDAPQRSQGDGVAPPSCLPSLGRLSQWTRQASRWSSARGRHRRKPRLGRPQL